jgi:hypothetical protein
MRNPLDPKNAAEQVYNKLEEEKLKSRDPQSTPSPFITNEKHINHLVANQKIFDIIQKRLTQFSPPIVLGEHIVHSWDRVQELSKQRYLPVIAHKNTLNGIDFIVEDRNKFLRAVRDAKAGGKPGFVEGHKSDWRNHWALALSFAATDGIGFREIFRPKVNDRPLQSMNSLPFDTRFGKDITVDISSLHVAVAEFKALGQTRCNIHIDNLTVTLGGIGDDVTISPTALGHIVNELLFKTNMQGKLPEWILEAFDISLLDPYDGFLRAGIGATIVNKPNFRWTINYSVGLNNSTNPEWSGSFKFEKSIVTGISGTFNLGGG